MVRRHEIQVLRRAGHSLMETAELVGVSQSTVQRVEAEAAVASFDTDAERGRRRIGRPSKAEPFRSFLVSELMAQPDVLAVELLDRARRQGYAGGKSALYELVKELRPERPRPIVRFEGLRRRVLPARLRTGRRALPRWSGRAPCTSSRRG